jgi:hypothetical protein
MTYVSTNEKDVSLLQTCIATAWFINIMGDEPAQFGSGFTVGRCTLTPPDP